MRVNISVKMHADLHRNDRYARTILCSLIFVFMIYANLYDNVHAEYSYDYQTATRRLHTFAHEWLTEPSGMWPSVEDGTIHNDFYSIDLITVNLA